MAKLILRGKTPLVTAMACMLMAAAQAGQMTTGTIELNEVLPANPCSGENIQIVGPYHYSNDVEIRGDVVFLTSIVSLQGIAGIGQTTGTVYRFVGASHVTAKLTMNSQPIVVTNTDKMMLVAQGTNGTFDFSVLSHTTVNPDGAVAVSIETVKIACR